MSNQPKIETEPEFLSGDQTSFSEEAELWQKKQVPKVAPVAEAEKPIQKNSKLMIGAGIGFISLVLLIGGVLISQKQNSVEPETLNPKEEITTPEQDGLLLKITQLKEQLTAADPTQSEYPFPPITQELLLDSPSSP